ncbi:MAG: hypothetical protein WBO10_14715 [Pyrinomonadaceae bacterium]
MKNSIKLAFLALILSLMANVVYAQTPTTAEGWFKLGNEQFGKKLYGYASNSFSECIRLNSKVPNCYYNRALSFYYTPNLHKAIVDFSKVLEFNLNTAKVYKLRGDSYRRIGKKELALNDLDKSIELDAIDPDAFYLRGRYYLWENKPSLAIVDFTRAIELNHPILHLPYLWRATQYCGQGKFSLAKADENKVIELGGKVYAACTANTNQNSGVSISANTDNKAAEEFYHRGLSLSKECQYQNAVAEFSKAIDLEPNNGDHYLERAKANIYISVMASIRDHERAEELWKVEPKPTFNTLTEKEKFEKQFEYNTKTGLRRARSSDLRFELSKLVRANKTFLESNCKPQGSNINQNSGNSNKNSNVVDSMDNLGFPKIPSEVFASKPSAKVSNFRQPTEAEIKASETLGAARAKNFDKLVAGIPIWNSYKIYGDEINRLANEDVYAAFWSLMKIGIYNPKLNEITKQFEERNDKAIKTISKYYVANDKNKKANLPQIPYPNDVPLPGASWDSICSCGDLSITGPNSATNSGETMTFSARVTGEKDVTYEWEVDKGRIISGQGTSTIRVSTSALSDEAITATVTTKSSCETCGHTESETGIVVAAPAPVKIDEFEMLPVDDVRARIDAFMIELQNDSTHQGYIINYGTVAQVAAREKVIKEQLAARKFPLGRLIFVNGGVERSIRTRLWIVPPGADASIID